jgi:hypothetical protein
MTAATSAAPTVRSPDELRPSQRLSELLPGIYRQRDVAQDRQHDARLELSLAAGETIQPPLGALVQVIGGGLDQLFDAVSRLWDDHFVERAEASALPLLAELFGVHFLSLDPQAQRALLARIVHWRRSKGTLATLEEALSETSGWDAEADEGFRSVMVSLDFAHLAPWRGRTAIVWDPIGMADPLTRRSPSESRPRNDVRRERGGILAPLPGEKVDDTLRRLGRVDAGNYAASPRTLDPRGFVRPDAVLIRTSRLTPVELEAVEPRPIHALPHGQRGGRVDPLDRDGPLVWVHDVVPPDLTGGLTARHEPPPPDTGETPRRAAGLLTPTALAEDPDRAEASGAFRLDVDGVPLVGPPLPPSPRGALPAQSVGAGGVVRFAEADRPSPGDVWRVSVVAALPEVDDPEATDILQMQADLQPGGAGALTVSPAAAEQPAGRNVDLIVERRAGKPRRRAADGTWTDLALDPALGGAVSNATSVSVGADTWVVRLERSNVEGEGNRLMRFIVGQPAWASMGPLPAPLDVAGGIAIVAEGTGAPGSLLVVATDSATENLGAWRITLTPTSTTVGRLDGTSPRSPVGRESPSLAVSSGRLFVFGGDDEGAAAGDMWSLASTGGAWRPHPLRRQEERIGAVLLATPAGLVLIGGDPVSGAMTTSCRLWDVAASRSWRPLPSLPFGDAAPGFLVARALAGGIEALVWADRTRPVRCFLPDGATTWQAGALETAAPNPPAPGEALFVGDDLFVIGPAPLPSSDLVFTQGPDGVLAVLPRLSLAVGESLRLRVTTDGATFRRDPPTPAEQARPRPLDTRFGGLLADELLAAPPSGGRYAQPGRLARRPWRLAQRSLGPWDHLIAPLPADDGQVFLDPRLGRFALPPAAPAGRITVSARIGRGGTLGPGLVPPGRTIRREWRDPDLAIATPPDLIIGAGRVLERDPHAYVAPHLAGQQTRGPEGGGIGVVADLAQALTRVPDGELPRIAVLGSARVPVARLTAGIELGLSLVAADPGSTPILDRDDETDLSLLLQTVAEGTPAIWMTGLWLLGRLELAAERGSADLRFCQLGGPGRLSLWAPGAGHQDSAARRSLWSSCRPGRASSPPVAPSTPARATACPFAPPARRFASATRRCTARSKPASWRRRRVRSPVKSAPTAPTSVSCATACSPTAAACLVPTAAWSTRSRSCPSTPPAPAIWRWPKTTAAPSMSARAPRCPAPTVNAAIANASCSTAPTISSPSAWTPSRSTAPPSTFTDWDTDERQIQYIPQPIRRVETLHRCLPAHGSGRGGRGLERGGPPAHSRRPTADRRSGRRFARRRLPHRRRLRAGSDPFHRRLDRHRHSPRRRAPPGARAAPGSPRSGEPALGHPQPLAPGAAPHATGRHRSDRRAARQFDRLRGGGGDLRAAPGTAARRRRGDQSVRHAR